MLSPQLLAEGLDMPEGPCLDAVGLLHVAEIGAGFVTAIDLATGTVTRRFETGGGPNGCTLGLDGALYVANNGGVERSGEVVDVTAERGEGRVQRCLPDTLAVETVYTEHPGGQLSGPNDITAGPDGALWITDPGHGDLKTPRGKIFRAAPDGSSIEQVAAGYQFCNGLAFTADGSEVFVAETGSRSVWAHPVDGHRLGERRLFAKLPRGCGADGLCFDSVGNLIVAGAFAGLVFIYDTDGDLQDQFEVDDKLVTSVGFAGPSLQQLVITLTHTGRLLVLDWPIPGLPLPGHPSYASTAA
jgi:gluconolactonase